MNLLKIHLSGTRLTGYNVLNHRYEFISGEVKCYLPMSTKKAKMVGIVVVN